MKKLLLSLLLIILTPLMSLDVLALNYTITFYVPDGESWTVYESGEVSEFSLFYGLISDPTLTGHTFDRWYHDANLTSVVNSNYEIVQNEDFYAKFTVNTHTLTFDTDGGSSISPVNYDYGSSITEPTDPTKMGYTFIGWTPSIPGSMPDEDLTVTAGWSINQYTLTFDTNGGSTETAITDDYGAILSLPTPTKSGNTFDGWYVDSVLTNEFIDTTMPDEDLTLYASWTPSVTHDVCFWVDSVQYDFGSYDHLSYFSYFKPTDPTKTGYSFLGWYHYNPTYTEAEDYYELTEDMDFYAEFIVNTYTIYYDTNGGNPIASANYVYNTAITPPSDPTRTGYTFTGWTPSIPATMPGGNITVIAGWSINEYTITFEENGGDSVIDITDEFNSSITIPTPTKSGFIFDGWFADVALTNEFIDTNMPAQNITLYAKWIDLLNDTFTVSFVTIGTPVPSQTVSYGDYADGRLAFTFLTGAIFWEWTTDIAGTNIFAFETTPITEDITLYAQFVGTLTHMITFDSLGGSDVSSLNVPYNYKATEPAPPYRPGYIFDGWYYYPDHLNGLDDPIFELNNHSLREVFEDGNAIGEETGTTFFNKTETNEYIRYTQTRSTVTLEVQQITYLNDLNVNDKLYVRLKLKINTSTSPSVYAYQIDGITSGTNTNIITGTLDNDLYVIYNGIFIFTTNDFVGGAIIKTYLTDTSNLNIGDYIEIDKTNGYGIYNLSSLGISNLTVEQMDYWYNRYIALKTGVGHDFSQMELFSFSTTSIIKPYTLYAKWIATTAGNYTVTFNSMSGSYVAPMMVSQNTLISRPNDPYREGYDFVGWSPFSSGATLWDFESDTVTGNLVLYAQWEATTTLPTVPTQNSLLSGFLDNWIYISIGIVVLGLMFGFGVKKRGYRRR